MIENPYVLELEMKERQRMLLATARESGRAAPGRPRRGGTAGSPLQAALGRRLVLLGRRIEARYSGVHTLAACGCAAGALREAVGAAGEGARHGRGF